LRGRTVYWRWVDQNRFRGRNFLTISERFGNLELAFELAVMHIALNCLPVALAKNQQKQVQATTQTEKEEQTQMQYHGGEKCRTDSKNMTLADAKYFLIEGL